VRGMPAAELAKLVQFQAFLMLRFVFADGVIPVAALRTFHRYIFSHDVSRLAPTYAKISVTLPAPTVLPPSRIANRNPFSIATGMINSSSIATLSPGITISTSFGKVTTPVTSVVLK